MARTSHLTELNCFSFAFLFSDFWFPASTDPLPDGGRTATVSGSTVVVSRDPKDPPPVLYDRLLHRLADRSLDLTIEALGPDRFAAALHLYRSQVTAAVRREQ